MNGPVIDYTGLLALAGWVLLLAFFFAWNWVLVFLCRCRPV